MLLDRLDDERHRAAEENNRITSASGRFMQPRSKPEFTLHTAVLQLARQHAFAHPPPLAAAVEAGRLPLRRQTGPSGLS